jgi:hypothetical protein
LPFVHSRSSALASRRCAAMCRAFSLILRAAIAVAAPATGVERDAYVPSPYGAVSVSPSSILISATGKPSSSAMIWANVVSWPWPWVWTPIRART